MCQTFDYLARLTKIQQTCLINDILYSKCMQSTVLLSAVTFQRLTFPNEIKWHLIYYWEWFFNSFSKPR